ncbi:methyltransferase FkbM [Pseudomonas sp. WHRI 8519]|uniref:methyltransferase FkbM n=1 Tax=Pseudomonas sp. WHRI 8519 TaxID=3162567 RepID=UPI0032EDCD4F
MNNQRESDQYDIKNMEHLVSWWQNGSYELLANTKLSSIALHPERSKIAVLIASGHLQIGNSNVAKSLIYAACVDSNVRNFAKSLLITDAHYELARAFHLSGQTDKALHHIDAALASAPVIGNTPTVSNKINELAHHLSSGCQDTPNFQPTVRWLEKNANNNLLLATQILDKIDKQPLMFEKLRESFTTLLKSELLNHASQLEAFIGIQNYINHGEMLPQMHGWPISPDLAFWLISLIQKNHYDAIIEFGSGTSTIIIAQALHSKKINQNTNQTLAKHIAFEHLEKFHTKTIYELNGSQPKHNTQVILAPLTKQTFPSGSYQYYSCSQHLKDFAADLPDAPTKILVLVDGPPARTGKHARYPALPIILEHFKNSEFDLLLDDYARPDEKEIVKMWSDILEQDNRYCYTLETRKMEKDACLISIQTILAN